ncbi:VC_2705 family sodium/solute symporter [Burkholderia glumae]|uniref:VC_2705 family sodium/solute symporter n=2 Tax=Burkholderia glumae TaxID=337 RepID=A0AAQ0BSJ5_BURGL|nr:VC_2705 family sodium/solute symporter [Burkholderia glumae]ACR29610.1 Na+ solute symporter-like protein [Burkholderia glumae BGR1]AJY66999.1 putative sodium:solute symporter, subfamily protein [Burkholderia glumae LMG 2196 = ATCC 33617]KHJ62609.1 sodium:solute symporter [Burkholderia glumae]MCM2482721.1 VC_2705 family sodium/solute symporter [Burkholderia glumae]MCM2507137.1 VC_2705 family sodium/solute symporter [Burkholderia glumae]
MTRRLIRAYACYTIGFLAFVLLLWRIERMTGPGVWIGYVFLFVPIAVYAVIGLLSRTSDLVEYYVAGRRVPSAFNGMATAADWLSAASFIGLAGSLYATGYEALAYLMGWTGGFCLVAFLLAPYVRKLARYTIPDFLGTRYSSTLVRAIAAGAAILCSFVYLVAQIQGIGLIATRFIGVDFAIGIFCGLAGILVCSFLGGMRAVTWTQVAQYVILISAFLIPVSLIGWQNGLGPLPQASYGHLMARVEGLEARVRASPAERAVREAFRQRAAALQARIDRLPASYGEARTRLADELSALRRRNGPLREISQRERELAAFPRDPAAARVVWEQARAELLARAAEPLPMQLPFPAASDDEQRPRERNFLALLLCLSLGTASLPHILTRYNTTTSVASARRSVGWTLFFIALFYLTVPVLAVLIKFEILAHLVGRPFAALPPWVTQWQHSEPGLIGVVDVIRDGVVHWSDIQMQPDIVVLAAPEIAGLPYVMSGLVAAGALAAALSTADGLLLTIANALSHDVYYHMVAPDATAQRRVTISKVLLLGVALLASYVASLNTGKILFLVGAAFSLAASSFFPVLVLAVFWKRTTTRGAVAGMVAGLGVCVYYIVSTYPFFTQLTGFAGPTWFGIEPISSGVFGVPAGFAAAIGVSLLDRRPDAYTRALVDYIRHP